MLIGEEWEKFSKGLYVVRYKNTWSTALAGAAQSVECGPENQRVAGSVPSQGTCQGWDAFF